jgi:hypothetical protein
MISPQSLRRRDEQDGLGSHIDYFDEATNAARCPRVRRRHVEQGRDFVRYRGLDPLAEFPNVICPA